MSLNLLDFEDINLEAQARVRAWQYDFEREFVAPAADAVIAQVLQSMSPGQRELLRAMIPDAVESVEKRLKVR